MFKEFFMRKMIASRLKNMPKEQQEAVLTLVQKNPDLMQKIALEVQAKVKEGKSETEAAMEVMKAHQSELQGLMGK